VAFSWAVPLRLQRLTKTCKDVVIGSVDVSGFLWTQKKERASPLFSAEQPSAELVSARRIRLLGSFCQ
jgi:hypothetical protein